MIDVIFNQINARLKSEVSELNSIHIYQQQDLFQSKSLGFKTPVAFIEMQNIQYEGLGANMVQEGEADIIIRIVIEDYSKNQLKFSTLRSKIAIALVNWTPTQFNLTRTSEQTDINADSVYIFTQVYNCNFREDLSPNNLRPIGGTDGLANTGCADYDPIFWGMNLNLSIDSNNDGIASGGTAWYSDLFTTDGGSTADNLADFLENYLIPYATIDYVNEAIDNIPPVDLSNYATLNYVEESIASKKGIANGIASLGDDAKIPLNQIPQSVLGYNIYQGVWNASINQPELNSTSGTKGQYYIVSVAGNTNLSGITDWKLGDWCVNNGTGWDKIDNTDAVISVNGQTGTVEIPEASNTVAGLISTSTQTFAGNKTFKGTINVDNHITIGNNDVSITIDTNEGIKYSDSEYNNSLSTALILNDTFDNYLYATTRTITAVDNINGYTLDYNSISDGRLNISDSSSYSSVLPSGVVSKKYSLIDDSTEKSALEFYSSNTMRLGANFSDVIFSPSLFSLSATNPIIRATSSTAPINLQTLGGANANNGVVISKSAVITLQNTDSSMLRVQGTFSPTSGSAAFNSIWSVPTFNQTGTASGTVRGIYYNPTITNILGTHYAWESTNGDMLVGGTGRILLNNEGIAKTALESPTSNQLRVGSGFSNLSLPPTVYLSGSLIAGISTSALTLQTLGGSSVNNGIIVSRTTSVASTSGLVRILTVSSTFSPTSGDAEFNSLTVSPTYNQTVSATGTIRGIYYNPNITNILGTHNAWESLSGNVVIGGNSNVALLLHNNGSTPLTALSSTASSVLTIGGGFNTLSVPSRITRNGTITVITGGDLSIQTPSAQGLVVSKTSNSSVGDLYSIKIIGNVGSGGPANYVGYSALNTINAPSQTGYISMFEANPTITSLNNVLYGFRSQISSSGFTGGGTTWNIYVDGTAPNYLAGNTSIGTIINTANINIGASTTTKASMRFINGTAPTSPNDGDIWYDGINLKMRIGGTTKTFTMN